MHLRDARTLGVLVVALALSVGGSAAVGAVPSGADLPVSASPADQAPTSIDSCTTIDEPGTYVLSEGIENGGKTAISKACINITADDVTFRGDGHLIDGRGVSHTKGIHVRDAEGVTIENVEIDDWHSGVLVTNGSATVRNVRTFSNTYGVRLEGATGGTIENSTIEDNLVGVYTDTENVTLDGNELSGNEMEIKRDY